MSKVILYIAVSIDGYIADDRGAVDWISEQDENAKMEDTILQWCGHGHYGKKNL